METTAIETSAGSAESKAERKQMKVLVAIDESEASFYALKWALDNLFRHCTGTTFQQADSDMITVVHVIQPFQNYLVSAGPGS
ncbi:hypothetical protein RJ640_025101 [Escallonia rubra]|uniref:UspA domain-containing protein n=1 Tax=Escallonia rubra TaxID=112253 RepID=A0AA88R487_9ASTE|nr:hypothetical protein RJ640_025101 [Escallonia rubra]